MTALSAKFGPYCKREVNPATFENELLQLTKILSQHHYNDNVDVIASDRHGCLTTPYDSNTRHV